MRGNFFGEEIVSEPEAHLPAGRASEVSRKGRKRVSRKGPQKGFSQRAKIISSAGTRKAHPNEYIPPKKSFRLSNSAVLPTQQFRNSPNSQGYVQGAPQRLHSPKKFTK